MVVIVDDDSEIYITFSTTTIHMCFITPTVPLITSSDIMINEGEGSATVTVQLQNEIEKEFVLNYNTGEVPDGADGMYVWITQFTECSKFVYMNLYESHYSN